ncbi:flagellar hook-associated protein FlgL [Pseudoalteromonas luteoviolacea]|uniref:Flagellar hook-associated protein FlgL n=1 Tax=Pseudoalteromonas luteoviolacea S4054 TaxID=1129367 RepID=A0A0F6A765_9GAMM|nr:flagellar hook-associated protein FlgL [Pseudoalteromonas luteoviolacea]AOT07441.1 flagellar biosynthesis protein FlgL [Pseudoalteromonas luteoviolacea]AOT12357.1 flagellar biosynthesis protein FlgL [Pseudoalteromonas luteoviolacea]AOT17270.1 flagellar biosynthesis protein FlgL [Pseudoalteromonas luteoviolacea]KKE81953.1 flagellar hook-associated protein FlgL [Pseudoalteromonas luteoviolacea S4054]KZN74147.1 flagellar hook-associated protein FlgL [Pseudoalteromonas luteoviolacea S4047-1]
MRLSHNMIFKNNLNSILNSQQEVNKSMNQVNTQKRVLSASDDPSAMARSLLYSDKIQTNEQYDKNLTMLKSRLDTQEGVLTNIKESLLRSIELTVNAGNGALTAPDKASLSEELEAIQTAVLELMNSKTEDGRYIFSGYQDNNRTYEYDSLNNRYAYKGDQGQHKIKVAEGVEIKSSDNGFDVFESVEQRLNVASNTATPTGGIVSADVYVTQQGPFDIFHKANYNPDPTAPAGSNQFQVVLNGTVSPGTYQLRQGATVFESGTYTENNIKVAGMEFSFTGVSGAADTITFELEAPKKDNVLNTLENLINAVQDPTLSDKDYRQVLADSMIGLENAKNTVSQIQSGLGGRKNTATRIIDANTDLDINNKIARADLIELDMAEAITELTKHETQLQASQATYGRLSNLSLLDYIR